MKLFSYVKMPAQDFINSDVDSHIAFCKHTGTLGGWCFWTHWFSVTYVGGKRKDVVIISNPQG